jgi:hypothetical protein
MQVALRLGFADYMRRIRLALPLDVSRHHTIP